MAGRRRAPRRSPPFSSVSGVCSNVAVAVCAPTAAASTQVSAVAPVVPSAHCTAAPSTSVSASSGSCASSPSPRRRGSKGGFVSGGVAGPSAGSGSSTGSGSDAGAGSSDEAVPRRRAGVRSTVNSAPIAVASTGTAETTEGSDGGVSPAKSRSAAKGAALSDAGAAGSDAIARSSTGPEGAAVREPSSLTTPVASSAGSEAVTRLRYPIPGVFRGAKPCRHAGVATG